MSNKGWGAWLAFAIAFAFTVAGPLGVDFVAAWQRKRRNLKPSVGGENE